MDQNTIALIAIGTIIILAIALLRKFLSRSGGRLPYLLVDSLLTPAERSFFGVLRQVADDLDLHLFVKVRMGDLMWIPRGTKNPLLHRSRIQQKHLDFVLCDRDAISPVLAIELDDASHLRADRQRRDAFVEQACAAAGLPLLRVPLSKGYDPSQLAKEIRARLDGVSAPRLPGNGVATVTLPEGDVVAVAAATTVVKALNGDSPKCPKCGASLVERQSRRTGEKFLGCPNYPNCRHTQPLVDTGSGRST